MEYKQLQYFLAVARYLNFSRAAESLYLSQSALSYQISELERELGVALFRRDKRTVALTEHGRELLGPALEAVEQMERLRESVRHPFPRAPHQGHLDLGLDRTEDHLELVGVLDRLGAFMERTPQFSFSLFHLSPEECVERLTSRTLDAAFLILRHGEHLPPELECRSLWEDRLMLVFRRREDCVSAADVVRNLELLLAADKPRGRPYILHALGALGERLRIHEVDSVAAAFAYVYSGRAAMVLPSIYFQAHPYPELFAVPCPGDAVRLSHALVWNRLGCTPALRLLLEAFPPLR